MTEPGGATGVGGIIGYLQLNREDWVRGVRESERDADRLGRLNPDIRISTNAGDVIGQLALVSAAERRVGQDAGSAKPFVVNLWAALAAVAPAALPIAAVAGGALIGLVPLAAAAALGIAGINDELDSGQLAGTRYGKDIAALGTEFTNLKTIAAGGLLSGLDRGLANSAGLFTEINRDTATMSAQLGDVASAGAPALLRILTQLNPLFETLGLLVDRGAHRLDDWTKSSTGVSHFVAYVQAELPAVLHFLGELGTLFSHIAQAAAPFGGVLLTELTLFVRVLNAIPIGVLQSAIPVVVSLYAAFKTYGAISAIIAGVNTAVATMAAPFAASAVAAEASALTIQAASAEEAATFARNKATEAAAAAEAAVAIAASVEGTSSILAAGATAAAESAIEFAAAMEAEALAAGEAAVTIGASAAAAAESVAASGKVARVGWAGVLGPLAAVGIGIALLTSFFGSNSDAAQHNQEIMNGYAATLKENANALAAVNVQQTAKNLQDEGAIDLMGKLNTTVQATIGQNHALLGSTDGLKLSQSELVLAVNGTEQQFDKLYDSLIRVADANRQDSTNARGRVEEYNATGQAAADLAGKIKLLRSSFTEEQKQQALLTEINRAAQTAINGGITATARQARALGVSSAAYLDAQAAAKKSTDQAQAQTLAWQLENDAGNLLAQTLDRLSGKSLSYAEARNSFQQALISGAPAKDASHAVRGNSAGAVTNQASLISQVQSAEQAAKAYGDLTKSTEAGRQKLIDFRKEIIKNAVAHGEDRQAVTDFINTLLKIPKKVPPTQLDVEKAAAEKKITDLQDRINRIKQGKEPHLDANSVEAQGVIRALQAQIDALRGKTVYIRTVHQSSAVNSSGEAVGPGGATGGPVVGPGPKGVDSVPRLLAPGEWIINDKAVDKYGVGFIRAINEGTLRMPATSVRAVSSGQASSIGGAVRPVHVVLTLDGRVIAEEIVQPELEEFAGDLRGLLAAGRSGG